MNNRVSIVLPVCLILALVVGCSAKNDESKKIYEEIKRQSDEGRSLMKAFTSEAQDIARAKSSSVKGLRDALSKLELFCRDAAEKTRQMKTPASQAAKDVLQRNVELLEFMDRRLVKQEFPKVISILGDPTMSPNEKNRQMFEWSKSLGASPAEPRKLEESLKKLAQEIGAP